MENVDLRKRETENDAIPSHLQHQRSALHQEGLHEDAPINRSIEYIKTKTTSFSATSIARQKVTPTQAVSQSIHNDLFIAKNE
jgi:hypothetical protein